MVQTADFQNPTVKPVLARRILAILSFALENKDYKQYLFEVLPEATGSCVDRIALSINTLEVYRKLMTFGSRPPEETAVFFKGIVAYELLQDVARRKVCSMRFVDEIKVYLGYLVKLREELSLPIDDTTMQFFGCSYLTQDDLSAAKTEILQKLRNRDLLVQKLQVNEAMQRWLRTTYAQEIETTLASFATEQEALDSTSNQMQERAYIDQCNELAKRRNVAEKSWMTFKITSLFSTL